MLITYFQHLAQISDSHKSQTHESEEWESYSLRRLGFITPSLSVYPNALMLTCA